MRSLTSLMVAVCVSLVGCATSPQSPTQAEAKQQVIATERAFAKTMADRNPRAFAAFISEEAVFFSGPAPLRGKQQVAEWWSRFFTGPTAPFAWEPEEVEVLQSGTLALSAGPVRDSSGKLIAHFSSIWRWESPGQWRIIFDKGSEECRCPAQ